MLVGGLQKCSTIDFPSRIACVIFTRGCGLNCFYCHNRQLIRGDGGGDFDMSRVWEHLKLRRGMLEGVVITGGEPTMQSDLVDDVRLMRELGYDIKLDTNGQRPDVIAKLIEEKLVDYCAVDLKATAAECEAVCGRSDAFALAAETIALLSKSKAVYEVRTTLYPGMSADMLCTLAESIGVAPTYRLNYFRMPAVVDMNHLGALKLHALTKGDLADFKERLLAAQPNMLF